MGAMTQDNIRPSRSMSFTEVQEAMRDMPRALDDMSDRLAQLEQTMERQVKLQQRQVHVQTQQHKALMLLHDRLDTLETEQKVTNLLLADLVSLHRSVGFDSSDAKVADVREDAYGQILNGG